MSIWIEKISIADAQQRCANTLLSHLEIEFTEVGEDYLMARMPVNDKTRQPIGIMHGGASCVLAESVGSTAANYCVDSRKQYCVGLDINTNHIRAIREGYVFAKASPYHLGHSTQVWHIDIHDEKKCLISVNRLTMMVLSKKQ